MNHLDLLQQSQNLQREGENVLQALRLLETLSQYGSPTIVGSMATGLMTWRDIDIEIVKDINEEDYWQVVKYVFHQVNLKDTTVIDYRKSVNPNTPKGLYLCIRYYGEEQKIWKIDIWFLPPRTSKKENINEWIKDKLTKENRKTILEIKFAIHDNPKYTKDIFSIDIYEAVIQHKVKDIEDFKKYLQKIEKTLE
jgi:hypothetical protein